MSLDLEMEEILKVFFEESAEGVDAMESGLLTLAAASCANAELINTIFRAAHSIKGGAGTFGFMEISEFTHAVETLLDEMRNGSRAATPDALQVLLQSVDVIRDMLRLAQAKQPIVSSGAEASRAELRRVLAVRSPPGADAQGMPARADAAAAPSKPREAQAATGESTGASGWLIRFAPDLTALQTCNDPSRIVSELRLLGPLEVTIHSDAVPALADIDPTQCHLRWTFLLHAEVEQARLTEIFDWVDANSVIVYEKLGDAASSAPVPAAGTSEAGGLAPVPFVATAPVARAAPPPSARAPSEAPRGGGGDAGSIRVSTEKVDALINLVGELVIVQSMLGRFGERYEPEDLESLRRGLTQLSRNTRELQESVMQIRMLPIGFSFNRFPRLVHDLSRKLGKKVELKINGENTELDKTVLEKIGDPLVHLVRNSLDHGLELPDTRLAAGKPEPAILELNAYHEGGSIVIEVKDDGAGLNTARILAKARERGLVRPDEELDDAEIHDLIFVAGFSTAEAVSDVSGRGVGMDVVRRNISDLGGHVQISSRAGRGSTIRIRLPLTLAILDGQMLRVGSEIYVASLISIIETVQPLRGQISTVAGQSELFKHRDNFIPVIRLHEVFDIEPDCRDISRGLLVVVEADSRRVAVLVDELLAQQQVVIKSLETNYRQVPGLAGATIHADGKVALILDVPGLISHHLERPKPPCRSRRMTRSGQYLSFILAGEEYGADILSVQEIKGWDTVTRVPCSPKYLLGVINLRGAIVPVVDLRARFGLERSAFDSTTVIVVVRVPGERGERTVGIVVDAVCDVYDVEASRIQSPPEVLGSVDKVFIKGLVQIKDKLVILLDIERLIDASVRGSAKAA